jgi:hypothetical protein
MNCKQHKFVDFEVASGSFGRQKKFVGIFEGANKTMEPCSLQRLVDRWHGRDEITAFVYDQDATASAILVERGWKVDEFLDKNHVVKSWERIFQQNQWVSVSVDKGKIRRKNVLLGLKLPLLQWFYTILNMDASAEAKKETWTHSYRHFAKPQCPTKKGQFIWQNRDKKECRRCLKNFLMQTSPFIEKCAPGLNTQLNESLHSLKTKLPDQNYNWKTSGLARCSIAILNWNEGSSWKLEMYEELGFPPLGSELLGFLKKGYENQKGRRKLRATTLHKAMTMSRRRSCKESIRVTDKGAAENKEIIHR